MYALFMGHTQDLFKQDVYGVHIKNGSTHQICQVMQSGLNFYKH